MSADHDRLDALRRLAKDRAATPVEKPPPGASPRRWLPSSATVLAGAGLRARLARSGAP
jgi:hypothetical protein